MIKLATKRSAVDTIKGYFYQFDYSIKKILQCSDLNTAVTIEGIEDIDIDSASEETAIQCKYYAKTEYNHSVIGKPIRFMLFDFMSRKLNAQPQIKYLLYGYYESGHKKLVLPISVSFLKDHLLTYTEKTVKHYYHIELGATDLDLTKFISCLEVNIHAEEYAEQLKTILDLFKLTFSCNDFDAEHFYYNNALKVIKNLASQNEIKDRVIKKSDFLTTINFKAILFNKWFIEYKGLKKYFSDLRSEYFTGLNSSPFDRFFLIEIKEICYSRADLKDLILLISKKWRKISGRGNSNFCPYIYINRIDNLELVNLKKELANEGISFIDGFSFQGSEFNPKELLKKPNVSNQIFVKFINEKNYIDQVLYQSSKTKQIFQFYFEQPYYINESQGLKHVKIQIQNLRHIKEII